MSTQSYTEHKTKITNRIRAWCDFSGSRGYILMAFARRKHNDELTSSTEKIIRRVIMSEDDIEENVERVLGYINQYDYEFRIYLTANARDLEASFYRFLQTMGGLAGDLSNGDEGAFTRIERLDSEWKSEVHSSESAADSYFVFDVDEEHEEAMDNFARDLERHTRIRKIIETPNGWHFITDPFNYTEFKPTVEYDELERDGMMHLTRITQ